ncbi:SBBP repeat-containing protein [Sporosarcina sp. ACRSM]|uniref:SBBP repeat-containing protein n=1 Tax=Sporosarcina sp. ACRSM TaxID=2918216 RepID=UPI001EF6DC2F|nr:SBBP repeat-containing protein [Sporosarcina sp. ACRSM]MCG7337035.1 SBBP repeat-containing protein [Sporosarcina sp. ACRSM]
MSISSKKLPIHRYGQLPLYFIPNEGQLEDRRIHYYAKGAGYDVFFTNEGVSFVYKEKIPSSIEFKRKRPNKIKACTTGKGLRLDFRLLGANQGVKPEVRGKMPGTVNYFRGKNPENGHTHISVFQEVIYREVWPGIDLIFRSKQGQIKYEFVLQPGAKIEAIRFTYAGADGFFLDEEGNLLIDTPFGLILDTSPLSYLKKDQDFHHVESAFQLVHGKKGETSITFAIGEDYEERYPLVIDPLIYSTYLGGSSYDQGYAIAVDNDGNAYITGYTTSTDFPTTPGVYDTTFNGNRDAFVTKLNATGTALVYSTYLGGTNLDQGWSIAVDSAGNAYVTGITSSSDFPITPRAFQMGNNGLANAFVTKLNAAGTALIYSTYLGGEDFDQGSGIAVDNAGNAYITGYTTSTNFPTTSAAFQTSNNGPGNAFVTKLNPTGSALVYSTYLGGTNLDQGLSIALDSTGSAYITGVTRSMDFPITPTAFQSTFTGFANVFVTKFNPTGSSLIYSTFLGGSDNNSGAAIAVDNGGNAYVTGFTNSTDFPTTWGAYRTTYNGDSDAFVTKLNPLGTTLAYSTYLGGTDADQGLGIAVDDTGNAYVTGATQSDDFPTTTCAFDRTFNGVVDAFVTKIDPTGTRLINSTYLGGTGFDQGYGIALDSAGDAYVTGLTISTDFPTSPDAFDTTFNGVQDAFVTKISFPQDVPLFLEMELAKDIQVQSDVIVHIQGNLFEPRTVPKIIRCSPQKEKQVGCICAKRVHDWVVFCTDQRQKGMIPGDIAWQIRNCRTSGGIVNVHCKMVPESTSFTVLDTPKQLHGTPGTHLVMIQFSLLMRIQYTCNGTPLCSFDVPVTTIDRVALCYPKDTSILAKVSVVNCVVVGE